MQRALQTAHAIANAHGLTVRPFEGLLDLDFGEWQGHLPEEVEERYPKLCEPGVRPRTPSGSPPARVWATSETGLSRGWRR